MTVAEKIKKESKNRTFERLMKVLDNAMKWDVTDYETVIVLEAVFIDGSSLTARAYF